MLTFIPTPETRVNTTANDILSPVVSALTDGGYIVVWQTRLTNNDHDMRSRRYSATGVPIGPEMVVNSSTAGVQVEPAVTALSDGGYAVSWRSQPPGTLNSYIYTRKFDASGQPVGPDTLVNASLSQGISLYPSMAALPDGGYLVCWQDGRQSTTSYDIKLQRFDAAGQKVGGEVTVNTYRTAAQTEPEITVLADGGYVVCWLDHVSGSSFSTRITGQQFTAGGVAIGAEFQVNTTLLRLQANPATTALSDGGYVIVWEDPSYRYVYAQRYTGAGVAIGGEARITDNGQEAQVTPLPDGGYVITWRYFISDSPGAADVYARNYDADGIAQGAAYRVNDIGDFDILPDVTTLTNGNLVFVWQDLYSASVESGAYQKMFIALEVTDGDDTVTGTPDDDILFGLGGNDTLSGLAGNDRLDGGTGMDTLIGGPGDDTYVVDNWSDVVVELPGEGTDLVQSTKSAILSAEVENLTLTGVRNLNGTGNALANIIVGNIGNNAINGRRGADTMIGGYGDDTYTVDDLADAVIELFGQGTDLVKASVDSKLVGYVENLTLIGVDGLDGVGNSLDNVLIGNDGDNTFRARAGADILDGGRGNDILRGEGDGDIFRFGPASGNDRIRDFSAAENDRIDVSAYSHGVVNGGDILIIQAGADALIDLGGGNSVIVETQNATDAAFLSHIVW